MMVVGISGPSGSGKSALCRWLAERLSDCTILAQDRYFKDSPEFDETSNFCELSTVDVDGLIRDVGALDQGRAIAVPLIDPATFGPTGEIEIIEPRSFLLLEGMTIFRIPRLFKRCDRLIYLTPSLTAIRRRKLRRDRVERARNERVIRAQLEWVEREYAHDLATLDPHVFRIAGSLSVARLGRRALRYILSQAELASGI